MNLIQKYNVAVPRYTSYPTVPAWRTTPTEEEWKEEVKKSFRASNHPHGISLYIHLPYCESLCTYCACNTRITVNHRVEEPYLQSVLAEWDKYLQLFDTKPRIAEIHLGGGTPTFFSPDNLKKLMSGILSTCSVLPNADLSFEGHPSNTTKAHLETLYDLGFRRVSFGIQDFDPLVQELINRHQSFEEVEKVVVTARQIGYTSVNFDLVYGLPLQKLETMEETLAKVILLKPDRIAFYSYAHVPWLKPGQRKFTEKDLPRDVEKRNLYEAGLRLFSLAGYEDIGMDHFALLGDDLYISMKEQKLHRNFMGYTGRYTQLLIGLGVSAISDTGTAFSQNIKQVEEYQRVLAEDTLPLFKGHLLTEEDKQVRRHILNIMCKGETSWKGDQYLSPAIQKGIKACEELERDGLVILLPCKLIVTERGKAFLRNICACFDAYLQSAPQQNTPVFSTAV